MLFKKAMVAGALAGAVLQPFSADLVAADMKLPRGFRHVLEPAGAVDHHLPVFVFRVALLYSRFAGTGEADLGLFEDRGLVRTQEVQGDKIAAQRHEVGERGTVLGCRNPRELNF